MEHISEKELIEYLAGTLPKARKIWIDDHVKNCQACQTSLDQTAAFNEILGQWQVDPSGHNMADKVTQAVQSKTIRHKNTERYSLRHRLWSNAWRIAATILLGVSVGHLAGRYNAKYFIAKQEGTAVRITPTYLAGLDLQFAGGLIWSVLEGDYTDSGEEL